MLEYYTFHINKEVECTKYHSKTVEYFEDLIM